MTGAEAVKISGRSKSWLQHHTCAWCNQTLWRALLYGCSAMYGPCIPSAKDFTPKGSLKTAQGKQE